jgi:hypothetical protein
MWVLEWQRPLQIESCCYRLSAKLMRQAFETSKYVALGATDMIRPSDIQMIDTDGSMPSYYSNHNESCDDFVGYIQEAY